MGDAAGPSGDLAGDPYSGARAWVDGLLGERLFFNGNNPILWMLKDMLTKAMRENEKMEQQMAAR